MSASIQNRLIILTSLIFLVTWIGASQISNTQGFRNAQAILEREVARSAELVLSAKVVDQPREDASLLHALAIWEDGVKVSATGGLTTESLATNRDFVRVEDGMTWVFSERCEDNRCVVYGSAHTKRHQNLYCLAASIFGPIFLILLAGFLGMLASVHYAMRPLKGLADKVARIDLERPLALQIDRPAAEFVPLVAAINGLGSRVRKLLDRERMFLGSCAHEIRTPLAGLIGQLQVSEQTGLENIRDCADRTARVANQFLTFASSKSLHASAQEPEIFELCETLREAIAPLLSEAEDIELEMTGQTSLLVQAHPFALSTVATNLVQNALKYARGSEKLRLTMSVKEIGQHAVIVVADNGPGMSEDERHAACQEFARFGHCEIKTGAGLGLAIVNEIVKQYNGTLSLNRCETLHGLRVEVALPIKAQPKNEPQVTHKADQLLGLQPA